MGRLALAALRQIWAALSALLLSGTISLIIFPFFTYVPTSGLLGEALPKVGSVRSGAAACCAVARLARAAAAARQRCAWERNAPEYCFLPMQNLTHLYSLPSPTPTCSHPLLALLAPLPQTLFFARIFADILGRFLPRLRCLAVDNGLAVLFAALCKLACECPGP